MKGRGKEFISDRIRYGPDHWPNVLDRDVFTEIKNTVRRDVLLSGKGNEEIKSLVLG